MGLDRKELLRTGNGAKLIEHHVEESQDIITFTFTFDMPMQLRDLVEFYGVASGKNVVFGALQRAGWFTHDTPPKAAFAMHDRMIGSLDRREWILSFSRD